MKSSTLRRSNITREKMAMLSALADYNATHSNMGASIDKQAELDILWRGFKLAANSEKSPKTYFTVGFFVGVVASLVVAVFISLFIGYSSGNSVKINPPKASKENVKFTFIPADKKLPIEEEVQKPSEQEYTVKAGDSLEDISVRFYGKFDETKIKEIQVKNNLKDINSIKIGQVLKIPMN